ncbi:hypothetical protein ACIQF6_07590 [Kitasatospora sp. NPDC092948]|uniref:hypothetical protein n=1 Tax=Kitasatospora sp. NPDC092948 TaxID=3364088 RepID=UPI003804DBAD
MKDALPLDNFDGAGTDLLSLLYGFFAHLQERPYEDSSKEKSLEVGSITHENRQLRVKLSTGSYGIRSRIKDRASLSTVFQRTEDDVELIDLRNLISVPAGADLAIIMTERIHGNGILTLFSSAFKSAFRAKYPGYTLEVSNLAPESAFGILLEQGKVKKYRLVRHAIPHDLGDMYNISSRQSSIGSVEMVVRPARNGFLPKEWIGAAVSSDGDLQHLLEWRGERFDEMKIEVKVGGTTRTVSVAPGTKPLMVYDLDEEALADGTEVNDAFVYGRAAEISSELAHVVGLSPDALSRPFAWPSHWDHTRLEVPNASDDQP